MWELFEAKRNETHLGSVLCGRLPSLAILGVKSRDFSDFTCYLCTVGHDS